MENLVEKYGWFYVLVQVQICLYEVHTITKFCLEYFLLNLVFSGHGTHGKTIESAAL